MVFDEELFQRRLETMGPEEVRMLLHTGKMANPKKVALANLFLEKYDRDREQAAHRERITLDRSRKNAAWFAVWVAIVGVIVAAAIALLR